MNIFKTITLTSIALIVLNSCASHEDENVKDLNTETVKVEVLELQSENKKSLINASGILQAVKSANLSTRFMGNVESVKVKTGQRVQKGELLLTVNSQDLQAKRSQAEAAIAQASSAFENAKKDYERFKNLHKKGSASDKELENRKSRFEMSEARLNASQNIKKEVEAQFDYLNIRAPFKGTIINVFTKEGEIARPGYPLLSIEALDEMEAQIMVSESAINQIKTGQKALIEVKSLNKELKAEISEVSLSSKNTGGQYLVKLHIEGANSNVLPGMFINASIMTDASAKDSKLFIPKSALFEKGQLKGLYIYSEDGNAILRWVRTGSAYQNMVEILSGVREGDKIITKSSSRLYNGLEVSL